MVNKSKLDRRDAESVAIQALSFLAADPARLGRFLAVTGIGPADIRQAARDPGFLAGVLEHIAADESTLLAFARETGLAAEYIARSGIVLSGPPVERDIP
ncbi:MAG TPA: DUF3572 domain-containing protein [Pseudorhodoplanes sp.]|nr:DUF3572 domain-containing protein [Pseudorhodoplanes sp.]HWV53325.1 DUF3572 domain-containing protein [Pseudorhodoplanes sp.]